MASLIKGQVLKHLSKFFKNLSMDSLNLSTMKGQCDFYNLELNEEVLMDILEFPVWLNLTKATCNHVVIKIPWTKLKTLPIQFFLDEVYVFVETCEKFRTSKNDSPTHSTSAPRKYGYAERLIDGIQITINSVVANFKSYEFFASFQLSHLTVESRTPAFKQCNDLRLTKIKDENRGQILTFKHIEWQALKLEAKSEATTNSTPLRLITGNGRFLLTIKKNLSDCQVVSARIVFIFDDLRWVLTDAMLLSAFHLITYVNNLMNKAPITKKSVEDVSPARSPMGSATSFESNSQSQVSETPIGRYFSTNDVVETSYHLVMNTLELYVCDDLKPETGRSSYPPLVGGGCLHVIVTQLVIDTYPYHKCLGSRQHWYKSALSNELNFVSQHIYAFADKIKKSKESENRTNIDQVLKGLLSLAMVVRVQKYKIEVVSTNTSSGKGRKLESKQKRDLLKNEILPDDMPSLYLEVNRFYYYEIGTNKVSALKKAPQPTSYLQVAPFLFLFDPLTLIWVNAFYSNLHKAIVELKSLLPASESDITMHSKIELLMPTFIFDLAEGTEVVCNNTSFHSLEAKCTKITLTNNFNDPLNFGNINNLLEDIAKSSLFSEKDAYPWIEDVDAQPISNQFMSLLKKLDSLGSVYLSNLWIVNCDPFWIEFRQQKSMKVDALVDPIQVNAWIFTPDEDPKQKDSHLESNSTVHILFSVNSALKVFIDHDKFLFLMRLFEQMDIFNDYLASDTLRITRDELDDSDVTTVSVSSVISDIQIILLLSQEWSKMRSIGTSLCASPPLLTPVKESEFAQNEDISKNSSIGNKFADKVNYSPQSKLISKSESDTLLVANLSTKQNREEQKLPTLLFHKPLTAAPQMCVTRGTVEYRRTGSYSTLASDTPADISPFDDDTRSLRSDLSGDSDLCILNGLDTCYEENDFTFTKGKEEAKVEEAIDISQCSEVISTEYPVSMSFLAIDIPKLSIVKQATGFLSSSLIQCNGLNVEEHMKLPFDDYKSFILKSTNNSTAGTQSCNEAKLSLRVDAFSKPGSKSDFLSLFVNNVNVELNSDTVQELTDFITDPGAVEVKPMLALLQNCSAKLIDVNVKTPATVIKLSELAVRKDCDNVLTLVPKVSGDSRKLLLSPHIDLLKRHLKRTVSELCETEKSSEELFNDILMQNEKLLAEIKRLKEENQHLQSLHKSKQNGIQ